jgi:lipopolysaccharide export system protein LptA
MWLILVACAVSNVPAAEAEGPLPAVTVTGVEVEAPGVRLSAAEARFDGEIGGDATGVASAARAELTGGVGLIVEGQRSTFDLRRGQATFEGDVRVRRAGDVELHCDRLEATYSDGVLVSARASGRVRVSQAGSRSAEATEAQIWVDRLRLSGSVTVHEGDDRLAADTVTLWFDTDRLECEGCRLELSALPRSAGGAPR